MKHSPLIYAQALNSVLADTPKGEEAKVLKDFASTLSRYGDIALADKIAEELEAIITTEAGGRMVTIETARNLPEQEMTALQKRFGVKDRIKWKVNPELTAGVRIMIDGEHELDMSFAGKLKEIFR